MNDIERLLIDGGKDLSVDITEETAKKYISYMNELKEWNSKMNLTAITDDKQIIIKHFLDSLSISKYIGNNLSLIDIGTGAGFPGLALKISRPDINISLIDSLEKRITFLNHIIDSLSLNSIVAKHTRVEDFGREKTNRESFDVAAVRAVATLPTLLEYALPLVKVGGIFIAMKGNNVREEIVSAKKALDVLGGKIEEIKEFTLPQSDYERSVIIIRKYRQTPNVYPRKAGKPSKEPIK